VPIRSSSILTTLGLRTLDPSSPAPPSLASSFLIGNFVFAYAALSTRIIKIHHGFDHNSSPRYDTAKYGEQLVISGKISRSKLEMIKRWESAHQNVVENYTLFCCWGVVEFVCWSREREDQWIDGGVYVGEGWLCDIVCVG
jgi:hypothetical protein